MKNNVRMVHECKIEEQFRDQLSLVLKFLMLNIKKNIAMTANAIVCDKTGARLVPFTITLLNISMKYRAGRI